MAKGEKKGFVLYYDYRARLALLSDEERGKPDLDRAPLMALSFIAAQIDRDAEAQRSREARGKAAERGAGGVCGCDRKPKQPEPDTMSIFAHIIAEEEGTAEE